MIYNTTIGLYQCGVRFMWNAVQLQNRMSNILFFLVVNLAIGMIIFSSAILGRLLGIQDLPLAISVVWPATGFALATLLLFGFRALPGIFLGNFIYNFVFLYIYSMTYLTPTIGAFFLSLGSLGEALIGGYIMRRYCSPTYFYSVRDIFIFLIPVGLGASLIASTVGVATLYFYGTITLQTMYYVWITFWVGDSMGVYLFTPLIVVWALQKPLYYGNYNFEIFLMTFSFVLLTWANFALDYPMRHLFLPLTLWVTYRFHMHGATIAIFFICIVSIIPTSLGLGFFNPELYPYTLALLVSFLETVVASSLILAAVINERQAAWNLLQNQNLDLQQALEMHETELKQMQSALFIKKKLIDSLNLLILGVTKQLQEPLKRIHDFIKAGFVSLSHLHSIATKKKRPDTETVTLFNENLKTLDGYLQNVVKFELSSKRIANAILELTNLITPEKLSVKPTTINSLMTSSLQKATEHASKDIPEFNFTHTTTFEESGEVLILYEGLEYAMTKLLSHEIYLMKEKKDREGASYLPHLKISTLDHPNNIEIIIQDNGKGASELQVATFFGSFIQENAPKEIPPPDLLKTQQDDPHFRLALAHDLIVYVHNCKISVSAKENEFLQIKILFPKSYTKKV